MNLSDLLNSDIGKQLVQGISSQTNASQSDTEKVLQSAIPAMVGGLAKNTDKNSQGIMKALEKHDGSVLDNLSDFLGNGNAASADGAKILNHIFGSNTATVANGISKTSGVSSDKVGSIISMAAPVLMGYLGKQKNATGVKDQAGLAGMLGGLLNGSSPLASLLDQNGDGKLGLDDLAGLAGNASKKGSKKSGGLLGGLLGGLFGKK